MQTLRKWQSCQAYVITSEILELQEIDSSPPSSLAKYNLCSPENKGVKKAVYRPPQFTFLENKPMVNRSIQPRCTDAQLVPSYKRTWCWNFRAETLDRSRSCLVGLETCLNSLAYSRCYHQCSGTAQQTLLETLYTVTWTESSRECDEERESRQEPSGCTEILM